MESNPISVPNLCEWCGGVGTCRCGRCHGVYYCSREHQEQHWVIHQKTCKSSPRPILQPSLSIIHRISPDISHNMPSSNISHNVIPTISHNSVPISNISHNVIPSNINHIMISSNISHNSVPSPSMSHNMISSNISHNSMPSSNIGHNSMPSSSISHNMISNIGHNSVPSSSISHNVMSSNISHSNVPSSNMNDIVIIPSTSNMEFSSAANWNQSNISTHANDDINCLPACSNVFDHNNLCIPPGKPLDFSTVCAEEILSTISNELLSSDNSFWNLIEATGTQNVSNLDLYLDKDAMNQMPISQNQSSASNIPDADNTPSLINDKDENLIECSPLIDICKNVIHDLNAYGICVLDKFIGSKRGNLVLDEVKTLYRSGTFEKGQTVKTSVYIPSEIIRSDLTTWVDGDEPYCQNIQYLMQKLDLIIAYCNKMPNNGQLSKYKLHRRTKAMVACYPGNGTHYKKHIDNPNKDGRCITCIYYLNQNWDVKKHGGILRMFPSSRENDVAQIAPIFDRMIFFWSDRRNPHEVLPAHAIRFAITVWYFDADERDAAMKRAQRKGEHSQSSSSN